MVSIHALAFLLMGLFAQEPETSSYRAKAASLEDAGRVPIQLEYPLQGAVHEQVFPIRAAMSNLLVGFRLEFRKKDLLLHHETVAKPFKVRGGRASMLSLPTLAGEREVLFYRKGESWFAAPARLWVWKTEHGTLEVLDADLDGNPTGAMDYIAWRGEAFRMQTSSPHLDSSEGVHAYDYEPKTEKAELLLEEASHPQGVADDLQRCWEVINELRNGVGLEPVRLDLERSEAALLHAKYLQLNGAGGSSTIDVHDEVDGAPGATPEGKAAATGNVFWGSGGFDLRNQPVHEFATLFHRSEFLFPSPSMGAGGEGGYGVVWVEDGQSDTAAWLGRTQAASTWVMVPAPGQQGAPTRAMRDSPVPASVPDFYSRQRGFPISVSTSYTYGEVEEAELKLFDRKGKPVETFAITMADAGFGSSGFSADFIAAPKEALDGGAEYRVDFRIRLKGVADEIRYSWTFRTGR